MNSSRLNYSVVMDTCFALMMGLITGRHWNGFLKYGPEVSIIDESLRTTTIYGSLYLSTLCSIVLLLFPFMFLRVLLFVGTMGVFIVSSEYSYFTDFFILPVVALGLILFRDQAKVEIVEVRKILIFSTVLISLKTIWTFICQIWSESFLWNVTQYKVSMQHYREIHTGPLTQLLNNIPGFLPFFDMFYVAYFVGLPFLIWKKKWLETSLAVGMLFPVYTHYVAQVPSPVWMILILPLFVILCFSEDGELAKGPQ